MVEDVSAIAELIRAAAVRGELLPRPEAEVCELLRDFFTCVDAAGVQACCALHVDLVNLAEVRSLVVRDEMQGQGIGAELVKACLHEAQALGIPRVYALTRAPRFFARNGFKAINIYDLPSKVFRDCVRCPKLASCDEVAMIHDIPPPEST